MATETDDYQLDTFMAVASLKSLIQGLKDVKNQTKDTQETQESWAKFLQEDMERAFLSAQAQWDLFKEGLRATGEFLKESVADFLEAEQGTARLSIALRNTGGPQGEFINRLDRQATALERLTGVDGEHIKSIQTLLTTMGVGSSELERFTQAALDLASATGQDATRAAQLLARANAEGKDELKRYAIEVDDAKFAVEGFSSVLSQVEERYGGLSSAQPDLVRQTNELTGAWKDFKEAVGETVLNITSFTNVGNAAAAVLDSWTELLTRKQQKAVEEYGETVDKSTELVEQYHAQLENGKRVQEEYAQAEKTGAYNLEALRKKYEEVKNIIKQTAEEQNKLGTGLKLDTNPLVNKITVPTQAIDLNDAKRRNAAQDKAIADYKKYREEMERISLLSAANLKKMDEQEDKELLERINKQGDWETAQLAESRRELAEYYESEHKLAAEAEEKRQQMRDEQVAKEKEFYNQLKETLAGYGEQVLSTFTSYVAQSITAGTRYNRALQEQQVARETAGVSEDAANKKRVEMQKELASENSAALLKMLADTLSNIAAQSAVKAVLEVAEAIAAAARYDYAGAAQHGAAAAAYAGVAVLAGGTAAVISTARPMTADEKANLQNNQDAAAERDARDKKATVTKVDQGPQVNVYNLGITGQTELQQAQELERIRRQYANLNTGTGAP